MKYRSLILACSLAMISCAKTDDKTLSSKHKTSNVLVTETDGSFVGTFAKDATDTQTLVATSGDIADTSVDVPPGTLAIDSKITLAPAEDVITDHKLPSELNLDDVVVADSSTPIYLNDDQAQNVSGTLELQIPLPLDAAETSLKLLHHESKLAILYISRENGTYKIGISPLTSDDLKGTFALFNAAGFGYFQIVFFTTAQEEKEAAAVSTKVEVKVQ